MSKQVQATPNNPTQAANKTGVRAAVWDAPSGTDVVGTVLKQFAAQSFDADGTLTLDLSDVTAASAGAEVRVYAETATESFSALMNAFVSSGAANLDPTAWTFTPAAAQNIALEIPGGTAAAGDRVIIMVGLLDTAGANRTATAPNAQGTWTEVVNDGFASQASRLYVWDREMTASLSTAQLNNLGGNTYAIATSENEIAVAAVFLCRGARSQTIVPTTGDFTSRPVAPGGQLLASSSTVLRLMFSKNWPRSGTVPTGTTELVDTYDGLAGSPYNGLGLLVGWSRETTTTSPGTLPSATFTMTDPNNSDAEEGDNYTAATIIIEEGGGAPPPPPPSGSRFWFGAHQHGNGSTSFERYAGGSAFNFSVIRSHNAEYLQQNGQHMGWWTGRNNGVNIYQWSVLDNWCAYHKAKGRRMLWNVFGNPTFLARNNTVDAYGIPGGSSYVDSGNRAAYRQFVADTVQRIIAQQGAEFLVGVEAWNEPIGGETSDNSQFLKANGYANDWSLSSIQQCIADITQDVYLGVRAVNSTLPVIGFAHTWGGDPIDKIIASRCTDGSPIYNYCDWFSYHPYGMSDQFDADNSDDRSLSALKASFLSKLPASQRTKPLIATECALPELWDMNNPSVVWWTDLYDNSNAQLAQIQYDWVQEFKQGGWQGVFLYSVDGGYNGAGAWDGGDVGSGYQFLGLSSTAENGTINAAIAASWSLANTNLHSWG